MPPAAVPIGGCAIGGGIGGSASRRPANSTSPSSWSGRALRWELKLHAQRRELHECVRRIQSSPAHELEAY